MAFRWCQPNADRPLFFPAGQQPAGESAGCAAEPLTHHAAGFGHGSPAAPRSPGSSTSCIPPRAARCVVLSTVWRPVCSIAFVWGPLGRHRGSERVPAAGPALLQASQPRAQVGQDGEASVESVSLQSSGPLAGSDGLNQSDLFWLSGLSSTATCSRAAGSLHLQPSCPVPASTPAAGATPCSALVVPRRISSCTWHSGGCEKLPPADPLPRPGCPSHRWLFSPSHFLRLVALPGRSFGIAVLSTLVGEGMCLSLFLEIICLSTL